ncbi:MAG: lysylphosphatidylglycerol synthase transmembrane domain-containing protein [Acidobacteriota bacterium]
MLRSRAAQVAISLVLAAGLLFLFLRQVRLGPLEQAIRSASGAWLAASLAIALATFALRALRWVWLLRPVGRVPFLPAFLATAVGFAGNNLPARVGEVIRPALLARMRRLPFSALLASILFERALDGGSVVFFFLLAVALGLPGSTASRGAFAMLRAGALAGAAVFFALIGAAILLRIKREAAMRLFDRLARRLPERWRPRLRAAVVSFPEGFASLSDPRLMLSVAGGSLFMWLVINAQVYAVMRAFHIELPFSSAFVVTAAAVLGLAVPTPGGIGSYQAAVQYALTRFYGVPLAPASGVAVLAWAVSFVPITLIGLAALASKTVREPSGGPPAR